MTRGRLDFLENKRRFGRCVASICVIGWSLAATQAHALKFRTINDGKELLVYDCGSYDFQDEDSDNCTKYQSQFHGPLKLKNGSVVYEGDSAVLGALLRQNHGFSRIRLVSGGGDLDEGVKVGELFRQYNQFVFVPPGKACVSACTIAFLGGRIREVDPNARYEVHAYSAVSSLTAQDTIEAYRTADLASLNDLVRSTSMRADAWTARLLTYVQRMIGGKPDSEAIKAVIATGPSFADSYFAAGTNKADFTQIQREGPATLQEILMRIERDSFGFRLAQLSRRSADLGDRAPSAVKMLEIMFSSRITETYAVDQTTLKEMGYTNVRR